MEYHITLSSIIPAGGIICWINLSCIQFYDFWHNNWGLEMKCVCKCVSRSICGLLAYSQKYLEHLSQQAVSKDIQLVLRLWCFFCSIWVLPRQISLLPFLQVVKLAFDLAVASGWKVRHISPVRVPQRGHKRPELQHLLLWPWVVFGASRRLFSFGFWFILMINH